MTPPRIAAALIALGFFFLALAFLTGCVAVPVPPFGEHIGEAGTLHISTNVRFEPRQSQTQQDTQDFLHAIEQYQLSTRTLRDK